MKSHSTKLSRVDRRESERKRARREWWSSFASKMLIAFVMKLVDLALQWLF